jgi:hypothetical protein
LCSWRPALSVGTGVGDAAGVGEAAGVGVGRTTGVMVPRTTIANFAGIFFQA